MWTIGLAQSVLSTKLCPTLPLHISRSYAQLLFFTLYVMCQRYQYKPTNLVAAYRMMMKLAQDVRMNKLKAFKFF